MGRPSLARTANVAFLVFFALYTAGVIIWLLAGLPPMVANSLPAAHKTLHRWGAGDRGYVVASEGGLEQRASARSRRVPARELAVLAGSQVVIRFENVDRGDPHNFAIYRRDGGTRVVRGPTTVGLRTIEFRFPAPDPGEYLFRDEFATPPGTHRSWCRCSRAGRLPRGSGGSPACAPEWRRRGRLLGQNRSLGRLQRQRRG